MITLWAFVVFTTLGPIQVGPFSTEEICQGAKADINTVLFAGRPYQSSKCFEIVGKR